MNGYDSVRNVHANDVTRAWNFMDGIDSFV